MIFLFQIGDIRLNSTLAQSIDDVVVSREMTSNADSTAMAWTTQKIPGFGGLGAKNKNFQFKEPLIASAYHSTHQRVSKFNSLIERPFVDLFGYVPLDEIPDDLTEFDELAFESGVLWLHTTANIQRVEPNYGSRVLSVELDYQPVWEPVNRFNWKFSRYLGNSVAAAPAGSPADDLSPLPGLRDFKWEAQHYWTRKFYTDSLYMYDPDAWAAWHLRRPHGYPITGWGSGWTTNPNYSLTRDAEWWSAPTRSLYQWQGLPSSGTLFMNIIVQDAIWGTRTLSNLINLATLNTSLANAGYTGLDLADRLVIGQYRGLPSFVIRGSTVLENVSPQWAHTGDFLGQTKKGLSVVQCTFPATSIEMAQLHNFRVM